MTGGAFTPREHKLLAIVPNRCIEKPFDADELLRAIDEILRASSRSTDCQPPAARQCGVLSVHVVASRHRSASDRSSTAALAIAVTPAGHLIVRDVAADEGDPIDARAASRIAAAFANGAGAGLVQLGAAEVETALPAVARVLARSRGALRGGGLRARGGRERADRPAGRGGSPRSQRARRRCAAASTSMPRVLAALWRALDAAFVDGCASGGERRRVPARAPRGVEPGRARPLQPRREPQR